MVMRLAGQQLGRAFADPFRMLAAEESPVVEEELQQVEIVRPQMAAEEEVAPQPAVVVFDDGTGPYGSLRHPGDRFLERIETVA